MSLRLVIDEEAETELEAACDWYDSQRAGLGHDLVLAVDEAVTSIGNVPPLTVPFVPPELGAKRVLVRRYPYSVIFYETDEEVRIVAFAHYKRKPGYWKDR